MEDKDPYKSAISDVVIANRILARAGVLDAYGHCSVRNPRDPNRYLMSRSLAPALVTDADILEHDLDNKAVADAGQKLYYERWIHGEIYKARPDVRAIVHSHSPTVVPFASTKAPLRPLLHNAAFLGFGTPVFEIRNFLPNSDLMIGTAALGKALAETLGPTAHVVLLRGHGNVVVGPTMEIAVYRAYYTEINARQQLHAIMLGSNDVVYMNGGECSTTDKMMQASAERPWNLWKRQVQRDMRRVAIEDGN
ncbi:MAG: class II aldolase/adducin family protein [Hyphomicrobiales bacterium]|nr:class II aldolase/adducin family protein [Hyphomicrobiales bacterium]